MKRMRSTPFLLIIIIGILRYFWIDIPDGGEYRYLFETNKFSYINYPFFDLSGSSGREIGFAILCALGNLVLPAQMFYAILTASVFVYCWWVTTLLSRMLISLEAEQYPFYVFYFVFSLSVVVIPLRFGIGFVILLHAVCVFFQGRNKTALAISVVAHLFHIFFLMAPFIIILIFFTSKFRASRDFIFLAFSVFVLAVGAKFVFDMIPPVYYLSYMEQNGTVSRFAYVFFVCIFTAFLFFRSNEKTRILLKFGLLNLVVIAPWLDHPTLAWRWILLTVSIVLPVAVVSFSWFNFVRSQRVAVIAGLTVPLQVKFYLSVLSAI